MEESDNLRRAIDVMTAWATDPENFDVGTRLAAYVREGPAAAGADGEMKLMFGLIGLAGHLLARLEKATGESKQSQLQDIALKSHQP
jgi:hypothetical protein